MKNFKLTPAKGFDIKVRINGRVSYWYSLFTTLMSKDEFAAMMIVWGYLNLVLDADCPLVAAPYAQRYAWIGEIMGDAEREEVWDAAESSGLIVQGLNDFVLFALSSKVRKHTYEFALKEIVSNESYCNYLTPQVVAFCMRELF